MLINYSYRVLLPKFTYIRYIFGDVLTHKLNVTSGHIENEVEVDRWRLI